jgi:hypothetical protein
MKDRELLKTMFLFIILGYIIYYLRTSINYENNITYYKKFATGIINNNYDLLVTPTINIIPDSIKTNIGSKLIESGNKTICDKPNKLLPIIVNSEINYDDLPWDGKCTDTYKESKVFLY